MSSPHTTSRPSRRDFLKLGALTAGAATFCGFPVLGAEDIGERYRTLVPENKALPSDWLASLVQRGHARDAGLRCDKKEALPHIGMTVGGIGCGSVYLSGDGRLYVWDIFNQDHEGILSAGGGVPVPAGMANIDGAPKHVRERDGSSYIRPPTIETHPNPFRQECRLNLNGKLFPLDARGFSQVAFEGRWPLGRVSLSDPTCPLSVTLEAWTPFIPLSVKDSALPVTVLEYTFQNTSSARVEASLEALLENPCLAFTRKKNSVPLRTQLISRAGHDILFHDLAPASGDAPAARPDVVFETFEPSDYANWTVEGTAFGTGPVAAKDVPGYQGNLNMKDGHAVNSHASAPGADVGAKDAATGSLLSREVVIPRRFLTLLLGGGRHPGKTGVEVLVDGKVVAAATGIDNNRMEPTALDLTAHEGRAARIRIFDNVTGAWGNIGADQLVFTDQPPQAGELRDARDFGTMAMTVSGAAVSLETVEDTPALCTAFALDPGARKTLTVLLAWHFPWTVKLGALGRRKRHYARDYADALEVVRDVWIRLGRLRAPTFEWVRTWNDSTLPQWLLDRAALTSNTLQTQNCIILEDDRFWAWEGVNCCPGTCGHVWHYAQGPARLFPELERNLRAVTDFGVGQNADGSIRFRAESSGTVALDAQTGSVLRTWREHQMSPDDTFLKSVWPGCKKAVEWLLRFDENGRGGLDGLLDGEQHNTLDAEWYGKVHCLCSLYLAALRAAAAMADRVGDAEFAATCLKTAEMGAENIRKLYNGEFFEQEEDPAHVKAIGVGKGCYIDQVIGQWWAWNTGLGRIHDAAMARGALNALWRYNFVPDVGPFRTHFTKGRFYALPGDGGLLMCTWPNGGLRDDFKKHWQYGYFNECMSGFEWQAAAHMVFEGAPVSADDDLAAIAGDSADPRALTVRGLAVSRAIHDRYAPELRNPYNEVECSDHYARAAASYSLLLAACGFQLDGPAGVIGFSPRLSPENFRAPFTAPEGWGTFSQRLVDGKWKAELTVAHGRLRLRRLRLDWIAPGVAATLNGAVVEAGVEAGGLVFDREVVLEPGRGLLIG